MNPTLSICHVSYVMCHVSYIMCHMSYIMCHISCVMCQVSYVMCHISCVVCHLSGVICHVSCQVSCVICHMSGVIYVRNTKLYFFIIRLCLIREGRTLFWAIFFFRKSVFHLHDCTTSDSHFSCTI